MNLSTSSEELKKFCNKIIQKSDYVAIDTEFVRTNTYYPKLCLLQLAFKDNNEKKILVLDTCLTKIDFQPFINILKNKKIIKVFHAGRQDCEIFLNQFNYLPQNVFDTQIGAMVCGIGDQESYEKLVHSFLNIRINKSFQYTDWSKRPISKSQINYAANDVYHLCDIYEQQKELLKKLNRNEWVVEENKKLSDKNNYNYNLISIYKKIKVNKSHKNRDLILDLIDFREKIAIKLNLPRNHVIKDSKLINITKVLPNSVKEIEKLSLFSNYELNKIYNRKILTLFKNFSIKNKDNNKSFKDISEKSIEIINLLKILLKIKSYRYGVPTRLIASNQDLEDLILNESKKIPALNGWRWDVFGEDAIKLKTGKIAIYIGHDGVEFKNINI